MTELERIKKQVETLCKCGHNELTHVHFNGDLGIPEGVPTYCGMPTANGECECNRFQPID